MTRHLVVKALLARVALWGLVDLPNEVGLLSLEGDYPVVKW